METGAVTVNHESKNVLIFTVRLADGREFSIEVRKEFYVDNGEFVNIPADILTKKENLR